MIHHFGVSLNEQHTAGSLICHAYSHYSQISKYHMPAISPARAANVATHACTKLYNDFLCLWVPFTPCTTGSTWSDLNHCPYLLCLWAACRWWSVEAQTRSFRMCFIFSCLHSRSPMLHSGSSPHSMLHAQDLIFVKYLNAFILNLRYMAASKHVRKHISAMQSR